MSAFLAAQFADSVELLTDGITVDNDGVICRIGSKVHTYPELWMAYTGRGNVGAILKVHVSLLRLTKHGSFDEAAAGFEKELGDGFPAIRGHAMDGVLVGISESRGPVILYFRTLDSEGAPEPFKLHQVGPLFGCGPDVPDEELAALSLEERVPEEQFGRWGLDILDVWRRHPMRHFAAGDRLTYGVGGHVDHTIVGPDGCETYRLAHWPEDVVGQTVGMGG